MRYHGRMGRGRRDGAAHGVAEGTLDATRDGAGRTTPVGPWMRSPQESIPGVDEAAAIVVGALASGERIAVWGDYDPDGSTAVECLRLGMNVSDVCYQGQPVGGERLYVGYADQQEGFGLSERFVRDAHAAGASVLVTADCGSASNYEVALAKELGMRVIVCDHHRFDPTRPMPADVHLNPQVHRTDARDNVGAQVARKFADVIREQLAAAGQPVAADFHERSQWLAAYGCHADWGHKAKDPENDALLATLSTHGRPPVGLAVLADLVGDGDAWRRGRYDRSHRVGSAMTITKFCSAVDASAPGRLLAATSASSALPHAQALADALAANRTRRDEAAEAGREQLAAQDGRIGFVVLDEPRWSPWAGNAGQVSQVLAREQERPVMVLMRLRDDGDGTPLYKASLRTPTCNEHHHVGDLIHDEGFRAIADVEPVDASGTRTSAGGIVKRLNWGGHATVIAGTARADRIDAIRDALLSWADAREDWRR